MVNGGINIGDWQYDESHYSVAKCLVKASAAITPKADNVSNGFLVNNILKKEHNRTMYWCLLYLKRSCNLRKVYFPQKKKKGNTEGTCGIGGAISFSSKKKKRKNIRQKPL
jgi:hypothetical protein